MSSEQIAFELRQMAERIEFLGKSLARVGVSSDLINEITTGAQIVIKVCDWIDGKLG